MTQIVTRLLAYGEFEVFTFGDEVILVRGAYGRGQLDDNAMPLLSNVALCSIILPYLLVPRISLWRNGLFVTSCSRGSAMASH